MKDLESTTRNNIYKNQMPAKFQSAKTWLIIPGSILKLWQRTKIR